MNTTTSPSRLVLVLGGVAAAALALLMVTRLGLVGGSDEAATPAVSSTPTPSATSGSPSTSGPAKPAIELLPGLPAPVARGLQAKRVVVVSLYAPKAPFDTTAVREARRGALAAGAGFVALDVFAERRARSLDSFAGTASSPSVLVVKRPGTIVARFPGTVESAVVSQAAQNAGSRR